MQKAWALPAWVEAPCGVEGRLRRNGAKSSEDERLFQGGRAREITADQGVRDSADRLRSGKIVGRPGKRRDSSIAKGSRYLVLDSIRRGDLACVGRGGGRRLRAVRMEKVKPMVPEETPSTHSEESVNAPPGSSRANPGPPHASGQRACVVVLAGDRMGESFPLNDGRTTIGRGLHADVRVNDEGISRAHALIERIDDTYMLSDAGSTNGTFANGKRVERQALQEGDKIQIGASSVLRFSFSDESDGDMQSRLYETALRDRLTGVFNRSYFNNRLESDVAFALRHGKPLSLVRFDVDSHAKLCSEIGPEAGDALIREIAAKVEGTTRSEDIFARYGGHEFVIICRDVDALRASRAAGRILEIIAKSQFGAELGEAFRAEVSAGVSDLSSLRRRPGAQALIDAANAALALAQKAGGSRVEIHDPEGEESPGEV